MSPITDRPDLKYLGDGRWLVAEKDGSLTYQHKTFGEISVPTGFRTDLDSVPRLPLAYWLAKNRTVTAAVIHDWLYQYPEIGDRRIDREEADRIFLDVMKEEGIRWWRRRMIWAGVRAGGWLPWNRYREKDDDPHFV